MMGWVGAALGLVVVAELWALHLGLRRLTAQVAVLTLVAQDVRDRVADLETDLRTIDDRDP
jgi:hypothetical protein